MPKSGHCALIKNSCYNNVFGSSQTTGIGVYLKRKGPTRQMGPSTAERVRKMAYKLDGAKFPTLEELIEALYPMYADKMSEEEFKAYVEENAEET